MVARSSPALLALLASLATSATAVASEELLAAEVEPDCGLPCLPSPRLPSYRDNGTAAFDDDVVVLAPWVDGAALHALGLEAALQPSGLALQFALLRDPLEVPSSTGGWAEVVRSAPCDVPSCGALPLTVASALSRAPDLRLLGEPWLRSLVPDVAMPASGAGEGRPTLLVLDPAPRGQPGRSPPTGALGSEGFWEEAYPVAPVVFGAATPRHQEASVATQDLGVVPLFPARAAVAALAVAVLAGAFALGVLYSRLAGRDLLAMPTRRQVHDAVLADPGCTVGALARRLALDYKTVAHHVRVLRRAGVLVEQPGPQPRFFVVGTAPALARSAAMVLRRGAARQVLDLHHRQPDASLRTLAANLGVAPSTVSRHLRRLQEAGLVAPPTMKPYPTLPKPSPSLPLVGQKR